MGGWKSVECCTVSKKHVRIVVVVVVYRSSKLLDTVGDVGEAVSTSIRSTAFHQLVWFVVCSSVH